MDSKKLFRIQDIISIIIFVMSLLSTIYVSFLLFHETIGIGQIFLSLLLFALVFLTLFFAISLLRHFTGFVKRSWIFYMFQFLITIIVSFLLVSFFSTKIITQSQERMVATVKSDLIPIVTYIHKYKEQYRKVPQSIAATIKPKTINNIYYYSTSDNFILGSYVPSLDIDGAQIFYDSRDKHWYQFHNDMYQHYQDNKEKPKSIEKYISCKKQTGLISSFLKKIDGKWVDPKKEARKNSQDHLKSHIKSCEANHGASCTAVGMRYAMGLEVIQNTSLALKYYDKACELDDANGCHYLADMYAQGKGVQKDVTKATEFYKKACEYGSKKACSHIVK